MEFFFNSTNKWNKSIATSDERSPLVAPKFIFDHLRSAQCAARDEYPFVRRLDNNYNYKRMPIKLALAWMGSVEGFFRDSVEWSASGTESRRTVTFVGDEEDVGERTGSLSEERGRALGSPSSGRGRRHHHGRSLHK